MSQTGGGADARGAANLVPRPAGFTARSSRAMFLTSPRAPRCEVDTATAEGLRLTHRMGVSVHKLQLGGQGTKYCHYAIRLLHVIETLLHRPRTWVWHIMPSVLV